MAETVHTGVWEDQDGILRGSSENSGRFAARRRTTEYQLSPTDPATAKSLAWAEKAVDADFPDLVGYEREFEVERYAEVHRAVRENSSWAERHAVGLQANAAGALAIGLAAGVTQATGPMNGAAVALAAGVGAALYGGAAKIGASVAKETGAGVIGIRDRLLGRS